MTEFNVLQDRPSTTRFSPIYGAIQTFKVKFENFDAAKKRAETWARKYGRTAIVCEGDRMVFRALS